MRLAEALARCPALSPGRRRPGPRRGGLGGLAAPPGGDRGRGRAGRGRARRSSPSSRCAASTARPLSVLARARRSSGRRCDSAPGPNRLCAHAAATRMRARRPAPIVDQRTARRLVAGLPVSACATGSRGEWERAQLPGHAGAAGGAHPRRARDAARRGGRRPLREPGLPRCGWRGAPTSRCAPGSPRGAGRADPTTRGGLRAAARARPRAARRAPAGTIPTRAGRTLRALRLEARLAAGGGWRSEVALRSASADAERLRLAIVPRLGELPGPGRPAGAARARARARGRRTGGTGALAARIGAAAGWPRRCARCGRRPDATRCCKWSRSIPARACPNAARSSPRGARMARPQVYWPRPVEVRAGEPASR